MTAMIDDLVMTALKSSQFGDQIKPRTSETEYRSKGVRDVSFGGVVGEIATMRVGRFLPMSNRRSCRTHNSTVRMLAHRFW